jgi:hypothetical protein
MKGFRFQVDRNNQNTGRYGEVAGVFYFRIFSLTNKTMHPIRPVSQEGSRVNQGSTV